MNITMDNEERKKEELRFYLVHENMLQSEGIVHYFEWCEKLDKAFPGAGQEAEIKHEQVILAGKSYRDGTLEFGDCFDGKYADIITSWAVWCMEQNDKLKTMEWL